MWFLLSGRPCCFATLHVCLALGPYISSSPGLKPPPFLYPSPRSKHIRRVAPSEKPKNAQQTDRCEERGWRDRALKSTQSDLARALAREGSQTAGQEHNATSATHTKPTWLDLISVHAFNQSTATCVYCGQVQRTKSS